VVQLAESYGELGLGEQAEELGVGGLDCGVISEVRGRGTLVWRGTAGGVG
jgi:hypothetical protein